MRKLLVILFAATTCLWADDRYLEIARKFIQTMMEKGTDHYGPVHSPLFAAMLDLNTLSLPVLNPPPEFFTYVNYGQISSIGFGLPNPPVGIRPGDRAPFGNNIEHDVVLLQAMYALSDLTGDKRYAAHADAYLNFWLTHCLSPVTGLPASGEHMSWDFVRERAHGNVHEVDLRFPFHDRLYAIDPNLALRIADGLWMYKMFNKKVADYSRHSGWDSFHADPNAAYPRHAGFYIWTYANAYVQSRDPKFANRIEVLIESRTGKRPYPESLLVQLGSFEIEHSTSPSLRIQLWDAAELVPHRKVAWRKVTRELDEAALREPVQERPKRKAFPGDGPVPGLLRFGRVLANPMGHVVGTTLSPLWAQDYGSDGVSGDALADFTRYKQTADERFLRRAERIADKYLKEGFPQKTEDLWPRASGQTISLLLSLARESGIPRAKGQRYNAFAREVADRSIPIFLKNGLFRADGACDHYEAITGAGDLVYALLQLYAALEKPDHPLPHIDVNL
jgi:hypothetical protein